MAKLKNIDGSYGEGGGQVLRTALTLAALTGQPVRIRRIRAGRRKPGLAPQHLTNVLALAQICTADVQGAIIGSTEIIFQPSSSPRSGHFVFDVAHAAQRGSAGSVTLIFQTLLLPLAFASSHSSLTLRGGTHVPWSPPFEYITQVFLPTAAKMGVRADCQLVTPGFYPIGGGQIVAEIHNVRDPAAPRDVLISRLEETGKSQGEVSTLSPVARTKRGALRRIWGTAISCNLPAHVAKRMANQVHKLLSSYNVDVKIMPQCGHSASPGASLCLIAEYEHGIAGFCALGKRGKRSESVAEEACRDLHTHHAQGAPVDQYLADQLLLPMALASGQSELRVGNITRHLLTNAYIINQFIPAKITIRGNEGESGTVVVRGIGFA